MSLRTFLGPLLSGTVKNNNPVIVSSNTPSPSFLTTGSLNSNTGGYRNTGPQDCFQFVSVAESSLLSAAIPAASFPYTSYPVNTVQGVNYPIVFPAGSYIDNIDFVCTKVFTFGGAPTSLTINVNLIGAPGTTYATAQTIATINLVTANLPSLGVYATSNSGSATTGATTQTAPIVYTSSATPLAMIQNTGPSDALLQLVYTFTGGTTPTITAGSFALAFNYVLRNPDGSWYPQTPTNPINTIPVQTY
jgi:hypothetical protein